MATTIQFSWSVLCFFMYEKIGSSSLYSVVMNYTVVIICVHYKEVICALNQVSIIYVSCICILDVSKGS